MTDLERELLEALKALVAVVELTDNPGDEGCDSYCDEMNAARLIIAKAEAK